MSQVIIGKISRKGTIYLPKRVLKAFNVKEGDRVLMRLEGNRLILEFIPDPFSLALRAKKWAKTTVEEFEAESEAEQEELYGP